MTMILKPPPSVPATSPKLDSRTMRADEVGASRHRLGHRRHRVVVAAVPEVHVKAGTATVRP